MIPCDVVDLTGIAEFLLDDTETLTASCGHVVSPHHLALDGRCIACARP
jgi:hypothetical protein